jgi:hypothetical protein
MKPYLKKKKKKDFSFTHYTSTKKSERYAWYIRDVRWSIYLSRFMVQSVYEKLVEGQ